jgi:hypothetical protein
VARHVAFGRSADQARQRALGSDERNARLVAATRALATRMVQVPSLAAIEPGTAVRCDATLRFGTGAF